TQRAVPGEFLRVRAQPQFEAGKSPQARNDPVETVERMASPTNVPVRTVRQWGVPETLAETRGPFGNRSPPAGQLTLLNQLLWRGDLTHCPSFAHNIEQPLRVGVIGSKVGVRNRPSVTLVQSRTFEEVFGCESRYI